MLDVRRLRLLRELQVRGTHRRRRRGAAPQPVRRCRSSSLSSRRRPASSCCARPDGGLQLTAQAELLVEHTAAILDRLELAESDLLASLGEATGTVRVAIFQSAALALTARHAQRAPTPTAPTAPGRRSPSASRKPRCSRPSRATSTSSSRSSTPDTPRPWHAETSTGSTLTHDAIRLAVPRRGTRRPVSPTPPHLPWVVEPRGAASRHFAEQACRQAGFDPDIRFETADLQAHAALIASGNAVALMPDLFWQGRKPPVRLLELPGSPRRTVFTATRRSTTDRPSVVALRAAFDAAVADLGT